jgi:hypothetical protein
MRRTISWKRGSARSISFITSGPDIGATFDPTTGRVALPPSFQSLDLGILDPRRQP